MYIRLRDFRRQFAIEYTDPKAMTVPEPARRYRFGTFEADARTGELRKKGLLVRLHGQPFQLLLLLLEHHGQLLTREEIARELWPDGTVVDFEHGVNSAVNRIREALGDSAADSRFVETLARRGYRFVAPVERVDGPVRNMEPADAEAQINTDQPASAPDHQASVFSRLLATPDDLPDASPRLVLVLFIAMQLMYVAFYVGALANLQEIADLLSPLQYATQAFALLVTTAAIMIPVRAFLIFAVLFRAPGFQSKFLKLWPFVLVLDLLWSLSPFLLLHHINFGLALACTTLLIYSPFAQRSLVLMAEASKNIENENNRV